MNSRALIPFLLLLTIVPLAARDADRRDRSEPPTPLERGVVRIEIPDILTQDLFAYYAEDTLYIPFQRTCELLRIPADVSTGLDSLTGEFPAGNPFLIDRTLDSAWLPGRPATGTPYGFVRIVSGEPYVEYSTFFALLGITARYDWRELLLSIDQDDRLPIVQLYRNRQQYQALSISSDHASLPAYDSPSPNRLLLGSPIVDWNISGSKSTTDIAGAATLAVGAEVLFGSLQMNVSSASGRIGREPPRTTLDSWRWKFVAPGNALIREVEIRGTPSQQSAPFYDIRLTNALPGAQRSGTYDLTGHTGPAFVVELYDGNRLVSVTTADSTGFYALSMPIGYGTVERKIRYVSPFGESQVEPVRLKLDPGMLPAGQFDYNLDMGADGFASSSQIRADAQIALGITDRITLGFDAAIPRSIRSRFTSDSIGSIASGTFWIGRTTSARITYSPSGTIFGGGIRTIFPSNLSLRGVVDSVSPQFDQYVLSAGTEIPLGHISIGATGTTRRSSNSRDIGATGTISGYVSKLNVSLSSSISARSETGTQRKNTQVTSLLQMFSMPINGAYVTSAVGFNHSTARIMNLDLGVSVRLSQALRLGINAHVPDLYWKNMSTTATLQLDLSAARIFLTADRTGDMVSTSMAAGGSAMIAGDRVLAFPDFTVGSAVVVVRAFEDRNGDGQRDDDEPTIAPPRTELVRDAVRQSDRRGIYDHLTPFQIYTVVLDRWDHANRSLYPQRTEYPLFTSPASVSVVEIPYSTGFDVTGRCRILDSTGTNSMSQALHGIRVMLVSLNGTARIDAEIYSDGNIFADGVPTGTYRLEFDEEQIGSRHVEIVSAPASFELTETSNEIPEVTFRRRR